MNNANILSLPPILCNSSFHLCCTKSLFLKCISPCSSRLQSSLGVCCKLHCLKGTFCKKYFVKRKHSHKKEDLETFKSPHLTFLLLQWSLLFYAIFAVHLTFKSVDLWVFAVQGVSYFQVCGWNLQVWPFKLKLLSSMFLRGCLFCHAKWFLLLSVDEILN